MSTLNKVMTRISLEDQTVSDAGFVPLDLSTATTVGETHEQLGGTVESMINHKALINDTDLVMEAQAALESYAALLEEAGEPGIDKKAAAFMRVGLEHFERTLGIQTALTPSVEAYDGPQAQRHATTVSLEGIKEKTKALLEMLKKLIKELMVSAGEFIQNYIAGIGKLESQVERLQATASKASGSPKEESFSLSNPAKLFADGAFVGQDLVLIAGMTSYISNRYNLEVATYMNALTALLQKVNPKDVDLDDLFNSVKKLPQPGEQLSSNLNTVFPGNKTLVQQTQRDGTNNAFADLNAVGLSIVTSADAKPAPAQVDVTITSVPVITKRLSDIQRICADMRNSRKRSAEIGDASKKLLEAVTELYARSESPDDVDGATWRSINDVCRFATRVGNTSFSNFQGIVVYMSRTLQAYAALCERELSAYSIKG